MKFSEYPFLRYSFFFVLGVLLYPIMGFVSVIWLICFLGIIYFAYLILIFINLNEKSYAFSSIIPFLAYSQLIIMGVIFSYLKDIKNEKHHLLQYEGEIKSYLAVALLNDEPKPNSISNRVKVLFALDSVGQKIDLNGEVIIYHKSEGSIHPGDVLIISGAPQEIPAPKNPKEFHYKNFMLRQQIGHTHFVGNNFLKVDEISIQPIEDFFLGLRSKIMMNMDSLIHDYNANQVAKALLLGQKKNLEKELNDAYVTAGAMHVLAVSGLHVGIIYGFFFLFVKPYRLKIWKRVLYLSFIIILIWAYALLTGMSPSVMRAATMFSLMALAQMKSRTPSIFNAIALSALVLLLYDPFLIYAVGFQLSYLALTGIILIQPILVKLWIPKSRVVEYIWQISTVGFAAQLMTFPISAYYFHVFPTYFLISNLVAIPGAFLIMSFGVPYMLFSELSTVAVPLAWITEKLIILVNLLIFSIQDLPFSKIDEIFLRFDFMLAYWTILALIIMMYIKPQKWHLYSIVLVLLIFGSQQFASIFSKSNSGVVVYSMNSGLAIDYKGLHFFDQSLSHSDLGYKVLPNRKFNGKKQRLALVGFQRDEGLVIPLPDLDDDLMITKDNFFKSTAKITSIAKFENEIWDKVSFNDSLKIGDSAYKITLRE